jgi:hypothetical protein
MKNPDGNALDRLVFAEIEKTPGGQRELIRLLEIVPHCRAARPSRPRMSCKQLNAAEIDREISALVASLPKTRARRPRITCTPHRAAARPARGDARARRPETAEAGGTFSDTQLAAEGKRLADAPSLFETLGVEEKRAVMRS